MVLNQLYWVAYYAQIVSAEIATIFLNQVSAAGLYTLEDFRLVCDNLDLETKQERAHINAFKTVGEEVEHTLFGERLFTYPMRSLYDHTMVFADSNAAKAFWRRLQIQAFTLLSSSNAFLGSQYLLVRGLRTLNGKLVQHQLSNYYTAASGPRACAAARRRSATGTSWTSRSTSTPRALVGPRSAARAGGAHALRALGGEPRRCRLPARPLPLLRRDQRHLLVRPGAVPGDLQDAALAGVRHG